MKAAARTMIASAAIAVIAAVLALGTSMTGVAAQDADKESIVKDRQATMKAQGIAMASIRKYIDGVEDEPAGLKSADELLQIAQSLPGKFIEGTSSAEFPKSHAKPIIWNDWDKFLAAQKNLVAMVEKLNGLVHSGDKATASDQFVATFKDGCGGCHLVFREKL